MGLLDDAIREHLELKRRRGGDPGEIERAEREALGPVRREPEPIAPAAYDETEAPHDALDYDDRAPALPDEATYPPPAFDDELGHTEDIPAAYPEPAPEPELGALPPEPETPMPHGVVGTGPDVPPAGEPFGVHEDDDPWVSDPGAPRRPEPEADPFAASMDPLPEPPAHDPLGQETVEYRLEPEPHHEAAEDDVLEETPEFLQDAPEHDRLWFEQRPPRDFDFDN